jgi:peptidoglycan lytic transglycosylase
LTDMCAPLGLRDCVPIRVPTTVVCAFPLLLIVVAFLAGCSSPAPKPVYFPGYPIGYVERGMASWYGPGFHGNKTANGERYDMHQLTAAHRTLPLGSIALIRSTSTGKEVTVRINDRGPFAKGRVLDLSYAGAHRLGMLGHGTDQIELRVIGFQGRTSDIGFLRVQIGSFAEQRNAALLLQRAQRVYKGGRIQVVDLPDGRRYRVQVGEFKSENQAETAAAKLEADLAVQSFVFRDDS